MAVAVSLDYRAELGSIRQQASQQSQVVAHRRGRYLGRQVAAVQAARRTGQTDRSPLRPPYRRLGDIIPLDGGPRWLGAINYGVIAANNIDKYLLAQKREATPVATSSTETQA